MLNKIFEDYRNGAASEEEFASVLLKEVRMLAKRFGARLREDSGAAEEIAGNAILAIWEALESIQNTSMLKTYVYRVVLNQTISCWRRRRAQPEAKSLEELTREEFGALRRDVATGELANLGLDEKELVLATLLAEGATRGEIAEALGVHRNVVTTRVAALKARLDGNGE